MKQSYVHLYRNIFSNNFKYFIKINESLKGKNKSYKKIIRDLCKNIL